MSLITYKQAQRNFFDRKVVQDALGRETAKAMSRVGGFVRTTARRSIRPARRLKTSEMPEDLAAYFKLNPDRQRPFVSSQPGEAPRGRTKRLRGSILYAYDARTASTVIGPAQFPGSRSGDSPQVLEFGGMSYVSIIEPPKKKKKKQAATAGQAEGLRKAAAEGRLKKRPRSKPNILQTRVRVEPRPFMRPALNVVRPRIAGEFRNILKS